MAIESSAAAPQRQDHDERAEDQERPAGEADVHRAEEHEHAGDADQEGEGGVVVREDVPGGDVVQPHRQRQHRRSDEQPQRELDAVDADDPVAAQRREEEHENGPQDEQVLGERRREEQRARDRRSEECRHDGCGETGPAWSRGRPNEERRRQQAQEDHGRGEDPRARVVHELREAEPVVLVVLGREREDERERSEADDRVLERDQREPGKCQREDEQQPSLVRVAQQEAAQHRRENGGTEGNTRSRHLGKHGRPR